jgi:hypothetical protein
MSQGQLARGPFARPGRAPSIRIRDLICLRKRTSALPPSVLKLYAADIKNASAAPTAMIACRANRSVSGFARADDGPEKSVSRKRQFTQTSQDDLGRPVPSRKNNSLSIPSKSRATSALSRPDKRADRESSRNAGWDVVDASASARKAIAGRGQTRERFAAREANGASRVRQNRVVLTPVAGAKSAEACRPNRAPASHQSADDGDKTNSLAGESTA